jgi:lysophospholipase L1-like esterase
MQDSKISKNYKLISVAIVLGVVASYIGIVYLVSTFAGSFGLAYFLNSKNIINTHRSELMQKIQRDSHFKNINIEEYIKEVEQIITMDKKRDLGEWVSFKSFTPNVSGKYITTNDYGMRSHFSLAQMVQRARKNRIEGVRNIIILGGSVAFGYGSTHDKNSISYVLNNMLKKDGYEVFNIAQGGFTSFMDLFSLNAIGLYLEPDIIIVMEGYADTYHLAYESKGGQLAWGLFSNSKKRLDPEFALGFHYQNLDNILGLGNRHNRRVIVALQPLSGFENNSTVENKKIKKMWGFYPRIRELMKLAAKNNNVDFLDLSIIFKDEKKSSINFFDKTHLTVTGQRKVAKVLMEKIKSSGTKNLASTDYFKLRRETIKSILTQDFTGKYKTIKDY